MINKDGRRNKWSRAEHTAKQFVSNNWYDVIKTWWSLDLLELRTIQVFNLMLPWASWSTPLYGEGWLTGAMACAGGVLRSYFKFIYWYKLFVTCVLTVKRLTIRRGLHLLNSSKVNISFCLARLCMTRNCRTCYLTSVVS